ncbi:MAG: nuclear transport factor 2 family protein [Phycisphaeraceae bacterium]
MARILLLAFLLTALGCHGHHSTPQICAPGEAKLTAELEKMMHDSADAWTADDLDAFMLAFNNSPDLTFAIPPGITKGWAPLKERYAKSINKSNLWFTDIETTVITADTALVFARFHNVMKEDASYSTGLTTLLCQKIDGRWVIVHDHSSGLPKDTPRKDPAPRD